MPRPLGKDLQKSLRAVEAHCDDCPWNRLLRGCDDRDAVSEAAVYHARAERHTVEQTTVVAYAPARSHDRPHGTRG